MSDAEGSESDKTRTNDFKESETLHQARAEHKEANQEAKRTCAEAEMASLSDVTGKLCRDKVCGGTGARDASRRNQLDFGRVGGDLDISIHELDECPRTLFALSTAGKALAYINGTFNAEALSTGLAKPNGFFLLVVKTTHVYWGFNN